MKIIILIVFLSLRVFAQSDLLSLMGDSAPDYGATLLDSLKAYWKMEDVNDSYGSNNLTNTSSQVTFGTGKVNNAGIYVASNNSILQINDNADLSMGNIDFTIGFWAYANTFPTTNGGLICKYGSAGSREWAVYFDKTPTPDAVTFTVSNNGTATNTLNYGSEMAATTWYFIMAWHNAATDSIYIQVNNGGITQKAHATGIVNGANALFIGRFVANTLDWDGLIDETMIWKRVLTPAERTYLYNSGNGRTYTGGKIQ